MAAGGCGSDSINTELILLLWNSMWGHQRKTWHFYQSHSYSLNGVGVKDFKHGRVHGHPSMKWPTCFNYLLQNCKAPLLQTDIFTCPVQCFHFPSNHELMWGLVFPHRMFIWIFIVSILHFPACILNASCKLKNNYYCRSANLCVWVVELRYCQLW